MSQTGVVSWSQTAASNNTADTAVNLSEGMAPSALNDSNRAMMASVAKYRDDTAGALTTGGTSTAYTLTTNQVFSALTVLDGQELKIKFNATNGAAPTLGVDGLTAKPIQIDASTAVPTGGLTINSIWTLTYNNNSGGYFVVNGYPQTLGALTTTGNVSVGGTIAVTGTSTLTGNVTASGTLAVTGASTFTALTTHNAGLTINEIATPSNPASGKLTFYGKSGDALYYLNSAGTETQIPALPKVALYQNQQTSGTVGPSIASGAWTTYPLTTEVHDANNIGSLSTNQITLGAGTYEAVAWCALGSISSSATISRARLRDVTNSVTLDQGPNVGAVTNATHGPAIPVAAYFVLAGSAAIELQLYSSGGGAQAALTSGDVEVYASVYIRKIA